MKFGVAVDLGGNVGVDKGDVAPQLLLQQLRESQVRCVTVEVDQTREVQA